MRNRLLSVSSVVFGSIAFTFSSAAFAVVEDEEQVPLDKIPAAVVDAVRKIFPTAEMTSVTRELENDDDGNDNQGKAGDQDPDAARGVKNDDDDDEPEILYEVTLQENGREIEVTLEQSGEIEEIERSIDLKELPGLVTEALYRKFPKSTLKSAEVVYEVEDGKEELDCYEVKLETTDKKKIEAEVEIEVKFEFDED